MRATEVQVFGPCAGIIVLAPGALWSLLAGVMEQHTALKTASPSMQQSQPWDRQPQPKRPEM